MEDRGAVWTARISQVGILCKPREAAGESRVTAFLLASIHARAIIGALSHMLVDAGPWAHGKYACSPMLYATSRRAFHDSTFRNDGVRCVLDTVPKLDMVMQELRLGGPPEPGSAEQEPFECLSERQRGSREQDQLAQNVEKTTPARGHERKWPHSHARSSACQATCTKLEHCVAHLLETLEADSAQPYYLWEFEPSTFDYHTAITSIVWQCIDVVRHLTFTKLSRSLDQEPKCVFRLHLPL